jgi:hypothetical protein
MFRPDRAIFRCVLGFYTIAFFHYSPHTGQRSHIASAWYVFFLFALLLGIVLGVYYCGVHAVGQQSQQRKCLFTTAARQRTRTQQWQAVEVFSLWSIPVMTSSNSRGIGDSVFFGIRSPAI